MLNFVSNRYMQINNNTKMMIKVRNGITALIFRFCVRWLFHLETKSGVSEVGTSLLLAWLSPENRDW